MNNGGQSEKNELGKKIDEYADFVRTVLTPDLERCIAQKEKVRQDIGEYQELLEKLSVLQNSASFETQVDLAHGAAYCRAVAENVEKVHVHVGMGFLIELTVPEAIAFTKRRITFLTDEKLSRRVRECDKVQEHLQSSKMILDQLSAERNRLA